MADSPEVQAAGKRYQAALENHTRVQKQTNDPAEHEKAKAAVDAALNEISSLRAGKKPVAAGKIATSGPKSAWEMLTGK